MCSFSISTVITSQPWSQLPCGGALAVAVLPPPVIFSTIPHYILCMLAPVPFLFEIPPQSLCLPFWLHPALRKVRLEVGSLSISTPTGCNAWLPAWAPPSTWGALSQTLVPLPAFTSALVLLQVMLLGLLPEPPCPGCSLELWPISVPCPLSALGLQSGSWAFAPYTLGCLFPSPYVASFPFVSSPPWEYLLCSLEVICCPCIIFGFSLPRLHHRLLAQEAVLSYAHRRREGSVISSCIQIFWDLFYQYSIWVKVNDYERTITWLQTLKNSLVRDLIKFYMWCICIFVFNIYLLSLSIRLQSLFKNSLYIHIYL